MSRIRVLRKLFFISTILFVIVIISITGIVGYEMVENELILYSFSKGLFTYPPPGQTHLLGTYSKVGLLVACSNHCDYLAAQLFYTDKPKDEIKKYYQNKSIPTAKGKNTIPIEIVFLHKGQNGEIEFDGTDNLPFPELLYDFNIYNTFGASDKELAKGLTYMAIALDSGYDPGDDLRCH